MTEIPVDDPTEDAPASEDAPAPEPSEADRYRAEHAHLTEQVRQIEEANRALPQILQRLAWLNGWLSRE